MKKYEFKIAPAYSLYRGVSVGWQKGSAVMFLAERKLEEGVENLLKLAFEDYVRFVNNQLDCPKEFRADCRVMFMYVSKFRIISINEDIISPTTT